jgi:NADH:ubiquinone oxidoreductase subunit 6 (subunit J)
MTMKTFGQSALIAGMIGVLIFVVIFASVIPTVANQQQDSLNLSQKGANVTGASNSLAALTTLVFVAAGVVALVKFVG